MNFNEDDKRIIKRNAVTLIIAIIVIVALMNLNSVLGFLGKLWDIIFPFVLGVAIAFLINIPMKSIEKFIGNKLKIKNQSLKRGLSIVISLILIFGVLGIILLKALPQLINSAITLTKKMPEFINNTLELMRSFDPLVPYADSVEEFLKETDLQNIGEIVLDFLAKQQIIVGDPGILISKAMSIISGFTNFFIGLVFSIYCLASKEKLIRQSKELVYTFFREDRGNRIIHVGNVLRVNIHNFFTGQFLEAIVLGTLCFIGMNIFRFPFAPLVSTIIGFGALIPIFGAIIAAFFGALIISIESPLQAILFLIYIIILQQIDGNFVYPRIVGKQVGLPSMWVLLGITVGGSIMGVTGMLISVPIFSTVYVLLREYKNKTLKEKNIDINTK